MAWTAPMTAVANSTFTAAQFNTHVRDNLLETGPAKATVSGRFLVTSGANSIAEREIKRSSVTTAETTTSTSNTDLATVGPQISITTGTQAIVFWAARMANNTSGLLVLMDYAVSGASTRSASDTTAIVHESGAADDLERMATFDLVTGLTPGTNVFTSKYWTGGGTGAFSNRLMVVVAL